MGKGCIDLSEFPYCYFVNGATDAIHHWKLMTKEIWQYMCKVNTNIQMISPTGQVTCDVPGQYMDEVTGRTAAKDIHPKNPMYISIPSAADGNYFILNEQ